MKHQSHYLKLVALVAAMMCALGASAYDFIYAGYYYDILTDSTVAITYRDTNVNSYSGNVTIPESVYNTSNHNYYTVTQVGFRAFEGSTGLISVTIPNTVTTIRSRAFYNCASLQTIVMGTNCSFYNPESHAYSTMAFQCCPNLISITCWMFNPDKWYEESVSGKMFDQSVLDDATLYVPRGAIPNYQATEGWRLFAHIQEAPGDYNYDFEADGIYYKFFGGNLVAVTYKDDTYGCYSGEVVIPETVTYDGWGYIVSCIDERAFYRCPYLKKVTIPASVDLIENEAFSDAFMDQNNSSVTCLALTPPMTSPYAFDDFYSNYLMLYVPYGTKSAYQAIAAWNKFYNINELPYSFVKDGIYYKITGTGTVSVTYKDSNYNCYSGRVTIPSVVTYEGKTYTVTKVDNLAFFGCTGLTAVTIPETVTSIGNRTFRGCTALTSITIPNSVISIGVYAFENCTALKDVVIGSGMTSIGSCAFHGCTELEVGNITCKALVPPTLAANTFDNDHYQGASLYVPRASYAAYEQAPYWSKFCDIYEFWSLDEALNEEGGTIHFESTGDYPWTVVEDSNGDHYAQSGNAGVHNSTSTMTATVTVPDGGANLWFMYQAWGEGTSTIYDKCIFAIDGTAEFTHGALQNDWQGCSVDLPAGIHVLKWSYTKDGSVNPTGDYFAISNVVLTPNSTALRGDVDDSGTVNIADVTALIDYLLSGNATGVNLTAADVDDSGTVNIADVTGLIDYLLTGHW